MGGLGRTGTVASCILLHFNLDPKSAINYV